MTSQHLFPIPTSPLAHSSASNRRSSILSKASGSSGSTQKSFATCRTSRNSTKSPSQRSRSSDRSSQYSDCSSHASSPLLRPPDCKEDTEDPPYKPLGHGDSSLNMLSQKQKQTVELAAKRIRMRRKFEALRDFHRRGSVPIINFHEYKNFSYWWLPAKRIDGFPYDHDYDEVYRRVQELQQLTPEQQMLASEQYGQWIPSSYLMSETAAPLMTRRWTSVALFDVEEGPMAGTPRVPPDGKTLVRNTTMPPKSVSFDIVDTVRSQLCTRKVSVAHLETPATITLRRASHSSLSRGQRTISTSASTIISSICLSNTEKLNALGWSCAQSHKPLAAYLITSRDVDRIADAIDLVFDKARLLASQVDNEVKISSQTKDLDKDRRPSIISTGIIPRRSSSAGTATTIPTVEDRVKSIFGISTKNSNHSPRRKSRSVSRVFTDNGVNEIIWEDSFGGKSSEGQLSSELIVKTDTRLGPQNASTRDTAPLSEEEKFYDALRTKPILTASGEWTWDFSRRKSSGTSSSRSSRKTSRISQNSRNRKNSMVNNPQLTTKEKMVEVVSFPALTERQHSKDWISPLPDIDSEPENNRTLYSQGFDAHLGSQGSRLVSLATTPKLELNSDPMDAAFGVFDSGESMKLDQESTSYDTNVTVAKGKGRQTVDIDSRPSESRRNSILQYPEFLHRTGEVFQLGSALGSSSRYRRRSSVQNATVSLRNASIDASTVRKTWKKPRKDSGWPVPRSPTPETEDPERSLATQGESEEEWRRHSLEGEGHLQKKRTWEKEQKYHRLLLLEDKTPPLVKADHAGIYAMMIGANQSREEDQCQSHDGLYICGESAATTRNPSVDWIG